MRRQSLVEKETTAGRPWEGLGFEFVGISPRSDELGCVD